MKRTTMFRPSPLLVVGMLGLALAGPGAFAQDEKPATVKPDESSPLAQIPVPPKREKPVEAKREERDATPGLDAPPTAPARPNTDAINKKLNSIIFPRVEFKEATVREAIEYLVQRAKALDQENEGVNIVLKLPAGPAAGAPAPAPRPKIPGLPDEAQELPPQAGGFDSRITLSLSNVPLREVLKYITNLSNLKLKVEPFAVSIVPLDATLVCEEIREWKVPATLFRMPSSEKPGESTNAQDFLASKGVTFPPGALAIYSRTTSTLTVKNSEENLDLVDKILETYKDLDEHGALILPRLEFKQARVSEAVEYLMKQVPDANILFQHNVRLIPVTVSLRNVTLAQALDAMQFTTGGQVVVQRTGDNMFQLSRNPDAASDDERAQVRIFSLATYFGQKEEREQQVAIANFEETLKRAVEMLRAADPASDAQAPRLQMNPSTKLLIAVGRKSDLALVEQLAMAVEGRVMTVPERGSPYTPSQTGSSRPRAGAFTPSPAATPPAIPAPPLRAVPELPPTPAPRALPGAAPSPSVPPVPGAGNVPPGIPPQIAPLFETKPPALQRN